MLDALNCWAAIMGSGNWSHGGAFLKHMSSIFQFHSTISPAPSSIPIAPSQEWIKVLSRIYPPLMHHFMSSVLNYYQSNYTHIGPTFPQIPHPLYTHQQNKLSLCICWHFITFPKTKLNREHDICGLTAAEFLTDQQLGWVWCKWLSWNYKVFCNWKTAPYTPRGLYAKRKHWSIIGSTQSWNLKTN